ncbi:MAG: hypothetical protein H6523_13170 [Mycolicibacterium sp.]|nr:hypothetical protein [Mycolicibacterium sp.]
MTEIRTVSGTHPWHPSVLADTDANEAGTADAIVEAIEAGRCPRCGGPLPSPPEWPAGSRITQCRSIPICGWCGQDEAWSTTLYGAGCWPLDPSGIEARRALVVAKAKPAILTNGGMLVTEDGASPITNPRDTGGWAQHGRA